MKRIGMILAAAALASCELFTGPAAASGAKTPDPSRVTVSGALITVPPSLSGTAVPGAAQGASRALESTAPGVDASVSSYYRYARDQVRLGAQVAHSLKALVLELEAVKVNGKPLMGQDFNYDGVAAEPDNTEPLQWASLGNQTYTLKTYLRNDQGEARQSAQLDLAYRLEGDATQVSGSLTVDVAQAAWGTPATGEKHPDWVKATFDSSRQGKTWMKLEIQGYRSFADLGEAVQNTVIELTRDSLGEVTVTSNSKVPNSRHFVWNGYLDAQEGEVLNLEAGSETRYYLFQGKAAADDKSTVSLAMAPAGYSEASVFQEYSIGKVLAQLFRDRLVNDYQFNSSETGSTGHNVIAVLNSLDTRDDGEYPPLSFEAGQESSPGQVASALDYILTTPEYENLDAGGKWVIAYLDGMMGISNPGYFDGLVFQSHGQTAPAGFLPPSSLEDLTQVSAAVVDALKIQF